MEGRCVGCVGFGGLFGKFENGGECCGDTGEFEVGRGSERGKWKGQSSFVGSMISFHRDVRLSD